MKRTKTSSPAARRFVPGKAARRSSIAGGILLIAVAIVGYWMFTPPSPYVPLSGLDPSAVSMIALGDQGSGNLQQWRVGQAMERVAVRDGRLDMVVFLGDNFYGKPLTGTHDLSWQMRFERVYWGQWLSHVPFFAVLGNHDYPLSQKVELEYAQQHKGSGRWQMPSNFYVKDFGSVDGRPLVRMVFLDTSAPREAFQQQIDLLDQAFQQPGPQPVWRIAAAHHPVRNHGEHGEDSQLVATLLPALQRNKVDVFLAGHDHNQQLVLRAAEPAWVVSGAGGQKLDVVGAAAQDASFATGRAGFAKLDMSASQLRLTYYDDRGNPETGYRWARDCQWMAKGCLLPDAAEQVVEQ
ncbi:MULTISPECIES: metallophosphoesterase [unclassified Pseudomonas]|uniref:metallophosphoesterase n=1 Tax=unclassified Pseudomonas TaxID=196821 RepID=UPI001F5B8F87|nr:MULTISPECIES: metallophosphoesterase [unclassified Pseudomonas]MEB0223047.1 metallophosphoesterase [Pseudomonas sp. 5S1]MEB0293943.1 metallophosphoesterase [Pseudomonas sp. 10S4]WPX20646.1 metallophosphoesterase [Pseudomonas sp. 10S4]